MNNLMKLFSIFVVFIQIQIALSQSIRSSTGSDTIQQLCKVNIYPQLCVSTLNHDPRSKNSNIKELASISVDAMSKKFADSLEYLTSVFKTIKDPIVLKRYEICITKYNTVVHWILPTTMANLKASKYYEAKSDMKSVVAAPDNCEAQFSGSSPLSKRNKADHDIADMTADIIRYLYGN